MVSSRNCPWLNEGVTTVTSGQVLPPADAPGGGSSLLSLANRFCRAADGGGWLMMGSAWWMDSPVESRPMTSRVERLENQSPRHAVSRDRHRHARHNSVWTDARGS
jgi:hypothetical protein